jgi:hypothetical protein
VRSNTLLRTSRLALLSSTVLALSARIDPAWTASTGAASWLRTTSDQNIALRGKDGAVKGQKYFPAPRESGLTRALKYASAVRAAYYTAAYGYTSAAFGATSSSIQVTDPTSAAARDITGARGDAHGDAATTGMSGIQRFMAEANARFKATTSTTARHCARTGEKNVYGQQAISKVDGSVMGPFPWAATRPRSMKWTASPTPCTCWRAMA